MIRTIRDERRLGKPRFWWGEVAQYPQLRVKRYWIRPFNVIGRWFRNEIFQLDTTLNANILDEDLCYQRFDPIPPPKRLPERKLSKKSNTTKL